MLSPPSCFTGLAGLHFERQTTYTPFDSVFLFAHTGGPPDDEDARDAAIAIALARCDRAAAVLSSTGGVIDSVHSLRAASALLQAHGTGPALRREIDVAIEELQVRQASSKENI